MSPVSPRALTVAERRQLERIAAEGEPRSARHAQALLWLDAGQSGAEVARRSAVSADTVRRWRRAFEADGPESVGRIRPGRGRKKSMDRAAVALIIHDTLHATPPRGAGRWTTRALAERHGVSKDTIRRIWNEHHITPQPGNGRAGGADGVLVGATNESTGGPERSAKLTRRAIAECIVSGRVEQVTVSQVANELGVTRGAIYRYFDTHEALCVAAADLVAESLDWPSADLAWQEHLVLAGRVTRAAFLDHPGLFAVVTERYDFPAYGDLLNTTADCLIRAGFDRGGVDLAIDMLLNVVLDSARGGEMRRARLAAGEDTYQPGNEDVLDWVERKIRILNIGLSSLLP
ncbi:MAG: helix-turn-helix domain-containing protein [Actinomycetota bacterium]